MISTGNTLVQAAKSLLKEGAISVAAAATHGVFSPGARDFLESSPLEKIFITNTIDQLSLGKIMVSDITPRIKKIMLQ
jgi:ribose-phosphate pyrophosphokinase